MPAQILPGKEVSVIVLTSGLKQVRVIAEEHTRDTLAPQLIGHRPLPKLNRTPGPPEKIHGTHKNVMARRHAGQRTREVIIENNRTLGETVKIRCCEFLAAVGAKHVPVQTVEQHDNYLLTFTHRLLTP